MRFYSFLGSLIFAQGCGVASARDSIPQVVIELTTDLEGVPCSNQPPYYCCPPDFFAVGQNGNAVVCIPEF